jgi:predicted DNA-binding transcriptional regulator YafY
MPSRTKPRERLLSRPPVERMLRIHQSIISGKFPNATLLAQQLEVSTKSIHRDIEFMRDRMQLPIEYDGAKFGYHYTEEVSSFPTLQISEGELFALLVAEKALQQYRGTPFEKSLISAFRKVAQSLPETISIHLSDWDQVISFRTSVQPLLDLQVFDLLSKAAARREQLELLYRKPGKTKPEPRIVDPYHLANINGEWFLFAYCHARQDLRTFAPARILKAQLTGKKFARSEKFSLEQRLKNSFGVHAGKEEFDVRLHFSPWVADYIREKTWHVSQRLLDFPDGSLELHMKLSSLQEVHRWILAWGGEARVLSPPSLAEMIKNSARRLQESLLPDQLTRKKNQTF